jgi:hypothetical protein
VSRSEKENSVVGGDDRALTFREARGLYGVPEHRLRQYRSQRALDFFKLGRADEQGRIVCQSASDDRAVKQ